MVVLTWTFQFNLKISCFIDQAQAVPTCSILCAYTIRALLDQWMSQLFGFNSACSKNNNRQIRLVKTKYKDKPTDNTKIEDTAGSWIRKFGIKCGSSREGYLRRRIWWVNNQWVTGTIRKVIWGEESDTYVISGLLEQLVSIYTLQHLQGEAEQL